MQHALTGFISEGSRGLDFFFTQKSIPAGGVWSCPSKKSPLFGRITGGSDEISDIFCSDFSFSGIFHVGINPITWGKSTFEASTSGRITLLAQEAPATIGFSKARRWREVWAPLSTGPRAGSRERRDPKTRRRKEPPKPPPPPFSP